MFRNFKKLLKKEMSKKNEQKYLFKMSRIIKYPHCQSFNKGKVQQQVFQRVHGLSKQQDFQSFNNETVQQKQHIQGINNGIVQQQLKRINEITLPINVFFNLLKRSGINIINGECYVRKRTLMVTRKNQPKTSNQIQSKPHKSKKKRSKVLIYKGRNAKKMRTFDECYNIQKSKTPKMFKLKKLYNPSFGTIMFQTVPTHPKKQEEYFFQKCQDAGQKKWEFCCSNSDSLHNERTQFAKCPAKIEFYSDNKGWEMIGCHSHGCQLLQRYKKFPKRVAEQCKKCDKMYILEKLQKWYPSLKKHIVCIDLTI
jgi:hypothetical protein